MVKKRKAPLFVAGLPADSLLSDGLQVPLGLLLLHRAGRLRLTVRAALGNRPLAPSTSHADAVDDKSLEIKIQNQMKYDVIDFQRKTVRSVECCLHNFQKTLRVKINIIEDMV